MARAAGISVGPVSEMVAPSGASMGKSPHWTCRPGKTRMDEIHETVVSIVQIQGEWV